MQNDSQQDLANNLNKKSPEQCNKKFCTRSLRDPSSKMSLLEKYRGKTRQSQLLNEILRKYIKDGLKNEIKREMKSNESIYEIEEHETCTIDEIQQIVTFSPQNSYPGKNLNMEKNQNQTNSQTKNISSDAFLSRTSTAKIENKEFDKPPEQYKVPLVTERILDEQPKISKKDENSLRMHPEQLEEKIEKLLKERSQEQDNIFTSSSENTITRLAIESDQTSQIQSKQRGKHENYKPENETKNHSKEFIEEFSNGKSKSLRNEPHKTQSKNQHDLFRTKSQESHEKISNQKISNEKNVTPSEKPQKMIQTQAPEPNKTISQKSTESLKNLQLQMFNDPNPTFIQKNSNSTEYEAREFCVEAQFMVNSDSSQYPQNILGHQTLSSFHPNERALMPPNHSTHKEKDNIPLKVNLQQVDVGILDRHSILNHETSNESLRTHASPIHVLNSQKSENSFSDDSNLEPSNCSSYASFAIKEPERPVLSLIRAKINDEIEKETCNKFDLDLVDNKEISRVQSFQENINEVFSSKEQLAMSEANILEEMKRASRIEQVSGTEKDEKILIHPNRKDDPDFLYSKIKSLLNLQNELMSQNEPQIHSKMNQQYSPQIKSEENILEPIQETDLVHSTQSQSSKKEQNIDKINNFPVRMTTLYIQNPYESKPKIDNLTMLMTKQEKKEVLKEEIQEIEEVKIFNISDEQNTERCVEQVNLNEALTVISLKKQNTEDHILSSCHPSNVAVFHPTSVSSTFSNEDQTHNSIQDDINFNSNIAISQVQKEREQTKSKVQDIINDKTAIKESGHEETNVKKDQNITSHTLTSQDKSHLSAVPDQKMEQTFCDQKSIQEDYSSETIPLIQNNRSGDRAETLKVPHFDPQRRIFNLYEPYHEVFNKLYNQYHIEECTSLRVCGAANIIGKMNYKEIKNCNFLSFNWLQVSGSILNIYGPEHTFLRNEQSDFLSPTMNERFHKRINQINLANTKMYLKIYDKKFTFRNTLRMLICEKNCVLLDITDKHVSGLNKKGNFYEVEMVHRLNKDLVPGFKRQKEEMENLLVVLEEDLNLSEKESQTIYLSCESETSFMNWLSVFFMRIHGLRAH